MKNYLIFYLEEQKPKTNVYTVINRLMGCHIGVVKWHRPWRQYCFFPSESTVFHKDCLTEIADFVCKLMEERKKGN